MLTLAHATLTSYALAQSKVRLAHSALEGSNGVWYLAQDTAVST